MIFHTLFMTIMPLVFSIGMGVNFFHGSNHKLSEFSSTDANQSLALFMPLEKKIITDVVSSNEDSC